VILQAVTEIDDADVGSSCWARLRRFHNVQFVKDHIVRLHNLTDNKSKENAKLQAENIRFSLMQAREYANAAASVTLATQPNLAYYSIMSLVIAEVLLKQMGEMHLPKMREQHSHHGLEFKIVSTSGADDRLDLVGRAIRCIPAIKPWGEGYGTFEVWHRTAREVPVVGEVKRNLGYGYLSHTQLVYGAEDVRYSRLPSSGLSLLDCMMRLPAMQEVLAQNNIEAPLVRAKCTREVWADGTNEINFDFQPGRATEALQHDILVRPQDHECVEWTPFDESNLSLGGDLKIKFKTGMNVRIPLPHCCSVNSSINYFWPGPPVLNEFGFYYAGLYMLSNYCRYFPDKWLRDVERASPLALAAERLLAVARDRVPLLALSEMSRAYYLIK
jgi:hypothetical protein